MILEEETFEKFGYYPSDLEHKSSKRILVKCDDCGKVRINLKREYSPLCRVCINKGKRNYNFGHKDGRTIIKCAFCGAEKEFHLSQIKGTRGKFCSKSCARKARKKFPRHHTKPELIFEDICKRNNLPFKYVGDSSFWIGKKPSVNPDFIECNGKKIAIEIFSYWHDPLRRFGKVPYPRTYEGRKKILKKYKWELIVFWQEDLEREDADQFVLNEMQNQRIL